MNSLFHMQEKQIFAGNLLFIACCGFYLAWWLLTFRTPDVVNGMKTGWLLIPASLSGLLGVVLILRSILAKTLVKQLLPSGYILWGGLIVYFILLGFTVLLLKRPATSELILIVSWGMLALAEINALFGSGLFSQRLSVGFLLLICVSVVISLICYILYYRLDSRAGYIDGMIPLLLTALTMVGISCFMVFPDK